MRRQFTQSIPYGSKPLLLLAALALCLPLIGGIAEAAQAQTGTIRVEVVEAAKPVAGATISASGKSAATDAAGVATLTLPAGPASLTATKEGYEPATARVDVVAGSERSVRVVLQVKTAGGDQTIVPASTRTGRDMDDQAIHVEVIGKEMIDKKTQMAPGDIAQLFNELPGLRVQTTSPTLGTTSLQIQGLPGRYSRLLADGAPLFHDRPGGYALVRIPPMDLERVEVIKGAMSAFYGSDALSGAVNLISRQPGTKPAHEFLFSQSATNATDGVLWLSTPATNPSGAPRTWSSTFLASAHRQEEKDVDADGWSDLPGYARGVLRPRVVWNNGKGRTISGTAGVTFETRDGGSATVRDSLETKTADGSMSGEIIRGNGTILAGVGTLFVQSRTRDFSDLRERDRLQSATIELTLRKPSVRHTWLAGLAIDWYALRSVDDLSSTYVSTRGGLFIHDDLNVAPWLVVSGDLRLDHHNLYGLQLSPRGSALVRNGKWSARLSAGQAYFTPRPLMEETEAAGLARLKIVELEPDKLHVETGRSVSADLTHKTRSSEVTVTLFRTQIDDPAQIDRATYTLRTETEPVEAHGVEILGTARRAPFSVTGTYTYAKTREHGDRDLALTPRHSAGLIAAAEGKSGRIGMEVFFTGEQRLDANPYRTTSEHYTVLNLLGEYRISHLRVFVNGQNLTDVHQTHWDPIARPSQDVDGRWTVDAWAPLAGRVINFGIRIPF